MTNAFVVLAVVYDNDFLNAAKQFINDLLKRTKYSIIVITNVDLNINNIQYYILDSIDINTSVKSEWKYCLNKLVIFDLCKQWDKLVYLDCDLVFKTDNIDKLFDELKPNMYNVCKEQLWNQNSNMTNAGVFGLWYTDKSLIDKDKQNVLQFLEEGIECFEQGALHNYFTSINRLNYLDNIWNTSDLDLLWMIDNNIDYNKTKIVHCWTKKSQTISDYYIFGKLNFITVNTLKELFKFIGLDCKFKWRINSETFS